MMIMGSDPDVGFSIKNRAIELAISRRLQCVTSHLCWFDQTLSIDDDDALSIIRLRDSLCKNLSFVLV